MKWFVPILALAFASRCAAEKPRREAPAASAMSAAPSAQPARHGVSLLDGLSRCEVDHEGLFIDLGTPDADFRREHAVGPFSDVDVAERSGAAFARFHGKRVAYTFGQVEAAHGVTVSMRALARASRVVTVYLDERRLGVLQLPRDEPRVVSTPPMDELPAGPHTIVLRFSGVAPGADDTLAEADWIRIGPPLSTPEGYAPPTAKDIVTDVVLGGEARRALVLRSPSNVRCPLLLGTAARLETNVGYWGAGKGSIRVRLLEDGEAPVILSEKNVQGGPGASWSPLRIDLSPYAGRVVDMELGTDTASGAGRVAFGEPIIASEDQGEDSPEVAPARGVVVIVGAGLDRRTIPPWGPATDLPGMGRLVHEGVAFDRYRAPTTIVSAVMATLVTGLSPPAHGLVDRDLRLDDDTRVLGERAREGSVRTGMFTGVPMSFHASGLQRGWDKYEEFSPVKDVAAVEPITRATAWIRDQLASGRGEKWLAVIHMRGEHPPWDVTREEVSLLPPEEYTGSIEPRGGAIALRNLRGGGRAPVDQRLSSDDWRRLRALAGAALRKQDIALRRLLEVLEKAGAYGDSMVVLMGDVATGDPPGIPFAPAPPLREDVLLAPLVVKFPRGVRSGTRSSSIATTVDVTRTILGVLGLDRRGTEGVDLLRLSSGATLPDGHAVIATLGTEYRARWGPWLLSGFIGKRPRLCLIEVDPACTTDALATSPIAGSGLFRNFYDAASAGKNARQGRSGPLRAEPDADVQAALKVFGY